MEFILQVIVARTMGSGETLPFMASEDIAGPEGGSTVVAMLPIKSMALAFSNGLMAGGTKDSGSTTSSLGKGDIQQVSELPSWACGKMVAAYVRSWMC